MVENIKERRKAVLEALAGGKYLSPAKRKELALLYECSPSAIWADCLTLINGKLFTVAPGLKKKIIARDKSTCYLCGKVTNNPMIEHKIPARAGGRATEENLAVACQSCNIKKRFRDEIEYPYE